MTSPQQTVALPFGVVRYTDVGAGPTLLFVHGFLVDGQLWSEVVARLAGRFRCVVPELPLGAHTLPVRPGADLSPPALARLLVDLMAALDLREVVLVGNDTGGALCQLVVADSPERLAGLVLTNCDAFEQFPPLLLRPVGMARTPRRARALGRLLRRRPVQRALFASLSNRPFDPVLVDRWLRPLGSDPAVARDTAALLAAIEPAQTLAAAERFAAFDRPVLLVWGEGDRLFFPVRLAERLAAAFPRARLVRLPGVRTLVPLDAPEELAAAVADFAGQRRPT